jgi:hypothetical protein
MTKCRRRNRKTTNSKRRRDDKLQKAPAPDDKVQKKEDDKLQKKEEDKLQRKSGDGGASAVGANTQSAIQNKTTGGQPLSSDMRSYMEPRLGADFSKVRIHNDTEAAGLSNQLSAKAFTYQNHVFFSRDQYQPGTSDGKQLLAHELTHTIQQGHAIQRKAEPAAPSIQRDEKPQEIRRAAAPAAPVVMSSEVVDVSANTFAPSEKVKAEIEAQGQKGLDVRVAVKGVTGEGHVKIRVDSSKNYDSIGGKGSMPLLNTWTDQMGGMFINFTVKNSAIKGGYASLKPGGGDTNDWVQTLQKNAALLGGLGLKIGYLPTPVNKFDNGTLTLSVTNLKVEIGGYVDALFTITLENVNKPKIDATADIDIKGAVKGQLKLDNTQDKLAGEVSLAVTFKSFSGAAKIKYNADGTVDVGGKAAYNADQLSGEIEFVSTDLEAANNFAKDAIAAAGGKENVQNAGPPAPVPVPKPGKKPRALAATGQLTFHLTQWFAGKVTVVVDGKGDITVIGKIAPPAEIELFKQRDWDKELIKFEAKAYYGIPVVGNLNLFANISLHALAKLGPAKIYNIEILGTYSTDPAIQKSIQISASLNISAYAGLRLRAEGGAGIEILDHDLKFGVGLNADIGVKAYADARPTIGYREPGEFYVSGTLEMVAQPMLGLGGDFFIQLETPWWSPLSDDKWTWPLFSKEWPLSDPIGINASVKDYVLGSGKVPEVELKKPEFDPSKFMTNMVDRTLPEKSGGQAAGQGSFKEDGSVPKPVVPPKKPEPKKAAAPAPKKGTPPKGGKSGAPDPKAAKDQDSTKILKSAATALKSLKGKEPFTRSALDKELSVIKKQVGGVDFDIQSKDTKWSVTPKAGGKKGKAFDLVAKVEKGADGKDKNKEGTVKKTFSLPKEGHTVTARTKDGKLQITIASDREGEILIMLVNAKSEVAADPTRNDAQKQVILGDLEGARQMVKSMNQDWQNTPNQTQDFATWAETRLTQIVNILSHLGADGIKAFRDFKGQPLDKRYLPAGYDVREKLYLRGSGWSGNRSAAIRNGKAEVRAEVSTVINNRKTNPSLADAAWNRLVKGLRVPDNATKETLSLQHLDNTQYDVDHIDTLSTHWQSGGNNKPDADRWALSGSDKIRYITQRDNLARQKGRYIEWVGKKFLSTYAQGGQDNAKKIDGQSFLDAPGGNPI